MIHIFLLFIIIERLIEFEGRGDLISLLLI